MREIVKRYIVILQALTLATGVRVFLFSWRLYRVQKSKRYAKEIATPFVLLLQIGCTLLFC
jgi:hypothetical protein